MRHLLSPSWTLLLTLSVLGPATAQLPPPPQPPENKTTEPKRILGKALFWDEQLSSDNTISCGTCHLPEAGGADPRAGLPGARHPGLDGVIGNDDDKVASPGVVHQTGPDYTPDVTFEFAKQVTIRKAPSVIGSAYFPELFWDGRAGSEFVDPETGQVSIASGGALETLSVEPILSSVEMAAEGRSWDDVREKLERVVPLALAFDLNPDLRNALAGGRGYPELFADAFGDPAINSERIAFALAAYQRTLNPDQTPWDRFVAGDTSALTNNQIQGLNSFTGAPGRCVQCHVLPLFSDTSFRNVGLRPIPEDIGRQEITGEHADRGKFKVPSLRNIGLRARMFHQGEFIAMPQVMTFYTAGGGPFLDNKDPALQNVSMPPPVAPSVTNFLMNGLTDPRVAAGLPPFDRPRLNSERVHPNPEVLTVGSVAGTGGIAPAVIAVSPPKIGSQDFKLGVYNGLGGATGFVSIHLRAPGFGGTVRRWPIQLSPDGSATHYQDIPSNPGLIGMKLWSQFWIQDPAAVGGFSRTEIVRYSIF